MRLTTLLVVAISLSGCGKSDEEFNQLYISKFVGACSKFTTEEICTCQAKKILEELTPEETSDEKKVRELVPKVASVCVQESMDKKGTIQ